MVRERSCGAKIHASEKKKNCILSEALWLCGMEVPSEAQPFSFPQTIEQISLSPGNSDILV
jgi:hypothetical protein